MTDTMSAASHPAKPIPAYHSSAWPECYDLWIRQLFGSGPSEDATVFKDVLQSVLDDVPHDRGSGSSMEPRESQTVTILDIGTGTGRVISDCLNSIAHNGMHMELTAQPPCPKFKFRFIGLEPSLSMLQRAQMLLSKPEGRVVTSLPKRSPEDPEVKSEIIWAHGSAANVNNAHTLQHAHPESDKSCKIKDVDLVIFAAGGICHLTEPEELDNFLEGIARVLVSHGRVVVSVLHEFLSDSADDQQTLKPAEAQDLADKVETDKPVRIRSVDNPEYTFVKYLTVQTWDEAHTVRTDRFKLSIEDAGRVVMNEELEWRNRVFDAETWQRKVAEQGLQVLERVDGKIQVWWILGRADTQS